MRQQLQRMVDVTRERSYSTRVDFKALVDIWKGITFEGTASFQNEEYRRERYSLPVQCYNWFGEQTAKLVYETTQTLEYSARCAEF